MLPREKGRGLDGRALGAERDHGVTQMSQEGFCSPKGNKGRAPDSMLESGSLEP